MATTDIAAQIFHFGRTLNSRMKAPIDREENFIFNIPAQSALAKLVRSAKLLLIDECTLFHRYYLEEIDRTLQDLLGNIMLFGRMVIVLVGNFRQSLPFVPHDTRSEIVYICKTRSSL